MSRPSCLHGVHCPHDSTARNRETLAPTGGDVGRVVEHDERGRTEARADRLHPLPARGRVELVGRDDRGRRALEHRADRACRAAAPPPSGLDDLAQRRAHRELADAGARDASAHRAQRRFPATRRCRPRGTSRRPRRARPSTCASVSTLSTSVGGASVSSSGAGHLDVGRQPGLGREVGLGLDHLVDAAPVRRRDARERVAAVDRLEQRGLLAEQVLGRSLDEVELHARRRDPTPAPRRSRRAHAAMCRVAVRFIADDDLIGADRERGDERAFEHAVRVAIEELAVLERAGLAFGRVHDHGRAARPATRWRRPSATSRRSGTRHRRARGCRRRSLRRSCRRRRARGPRRGPCRRRAAGTRRATGRARCRGFGWRQAWGECLTSYGRRASRRLRRT